MQISIKAILITYIKYNFVGSGESGRWPASVQAILTEANRRRFKSAATGTAEKYTMNSTAMSSHGLPIRKN